MPKRTSSLPRRWLTQQEAGDYLGVSDRTIRSYIAAGTLKGYKVRGVKTVRLDIRDLDALMRPIPTVRRDPAA